MTDERRNLPSASGIERVFLCPGSWAIEQTCDPEPSTADSERGDRVHAYLGAPTNENWNALDDEEKDIATNCETLARKTVERFLGLDPEPQVSTEKRIWLFDESLNHIFSGQADRIHVRDDRGLVLDFKTGRDEVTEAAGNWQLRALAVLASEAYGLNEVTVAIIQPWVSPQVTSARYTQRDLITSSILLRAGLQASKEEFAPRRPGEKQCRYCRAKSVCPEAQGAIAAVATLNTQWAAILPSDKLKLYDLCDRADRVTESIRRNIKADLTANPDAIPGLKLGAGSKQRKLKDGATVQDVFTRLSDKLDVQTFLGACSLKVAEAEKAYRKATGAKANEAKAEFNQRLADVIEEKESAPSIERVKEAA